VLWDNLGDRFGGDGDNTPELVQLIQLHQDRLIELLKQHILAFYWNAGDANAIVSLIPLKPKRGEKFKEIELAFPPSKPTLVVEGREDKGDNQ
jgi:hypothetical protein